jgi:serpin B
VLAMLNDGAWGTTREELLQVLGFKDAKTRALNEYFQKQMKPLGTEGSTKLLLANAMFVREGFEFKPSFVEDMKQYYDAKTETLDFNSPESIDYINDWCSQKTNGLIPEMVRQISPITIAMLFNAIYFCGKWKSPFEKEQTNYAAFTDETGNSHQVEMMVQGTSDVGYFEGNDYKALRMDYEQGDYCMTLLLPTSSKKVSDILSTLSDESFRALDTKYTKPDPIVVIHLPRFTVETPDETVENLEGVLRKVGITTIWNEKAELPNILKGANPMVSQVRQKAKIMVTEDGTEAAAITQAGMVGSDIPGPRPYPVFNADHPFVYIISNRTSGVIYFIGTYHGE